MTRMIAVMGAKDRVGASGFALDLAGGLKKKGQRVLLLDADGFHQGDLAAVSRSAQPWRTLADLQKIPANISETWLAGFLKGPGDLACLQLAESRLTLRPLAPKAVLAALQELKLSFDWVVADLGSRLDALNRVLLAEADALLFVVNPDLLLVEELKRKLQELSADFFPKSRMGWVGPCWDPADYLTPASVSKVLPIRFYGKEPEEIIHNLGDLAAKQQTPASSKDQKVPAEFLLKAVQRRMEETGIEEMPREKLTAAITQIIRDVLEAQAASLAEEEKRRLIEQLLNELIGLGPLEACLHNPAVTEILVNGPDAVYIETEGRLNKTDARFLSGESLQKVIERILLPAGRRVDESSPMVDCRLLDGSRVNIIIPPLSLEGPVISIRRFSKQALRPEDLIRIRSATPEMMAVLQEAVLTRKNILVSGGTGSGKTTLLNILSSFIPPEERIITIEDAAELQLNQPHVVRLEARPANVEGKGAITIRDLVRNALRMRPDRIIVGECRGPETLDMLTAMNTGHEGSLTTLHANSPRDAIGRLETLVHFAGLPLPNAVIREQIFAGIDLIVQVARRGDGTRRIAAIQETKELHEGRTERPLSLAD
ncbi:MAG: Flp pilus assembly complex ATPase component TadA [Deltaproteobacteria bacterium]|nr:Flp pilus assembly complex ATPase component TadA [Deltaproteobacteria bacterium]